LIYLRILVIKLFCLWALIYFRCVQTNRIRGNMMRTTASTWPWLGRSAGGRTYSETILTDGASQQSRLEGLGSHTPSGIRPSVEWSTLLIWVIPWPTMTWWLPFQKGDMRRHSFTIFRLTRWQWHWKMCPTSCVSPSKVFCLTTTQNWPYMRGRVNGGHERRWPLGGWPKSEWHNMAHV
jgi:hypothetical protein